MHRHGARTPITGGCTTAGFKTREAGVAEGVCPSPLLPQPRYHLQAHSGCYCLPHKTGGGGQLGRFKLLSLQPPLYPKEPTVCTGLSETPTPLIDGTTSSLRTLACRGGFAAGRHATSRLMRGTLDTHTSTLDYTGVPSLLDTPRSSLPSLRTAQVPVGGQKHDQVVPHSPPLP